MGLALGDHFLVIYGHSSLFILFLATSKIHRNHINPITRIPMQRNRLLTVRPLEYWIIKLEALKNVNNISIANLEYVYNTIFFCKTSHIFLYF